MKFKKLLISASAIAAGTGLLATVLTSCSKSKIDEDLKIKLDDEGRFVNFGEGQTLISADFHDALKNALGRSTGWEQFKNALAEEIVLKWYEDRAAPDKKSDSKNKSFRNNLEDWKHTINKDYDSIVDNCKSKYGANWKFYLQNENLVQNGGTEESYKHIKLLSYVKTEFIKNVFAQNYYGFASNGVDPQYPFIKTSSTMTPTKLEIGNPENWPKYGFFGKTNSAFDPGDTIDPDYLAKHPDGDYAAIQDYVFNRWFDTEKPFFSAAALFKYSNPAQSGGKLDNIYNSDWVSVPENPNEAYPFFGAIAPSNGAKGTQAFWEWYWAMMAGEFETDGLYGDKRDKYNGTITMNGALTEDSQTLLLCTGSDIFTSLYTPYAIAAANLYGEMFDGQCRSLNTMKQSFLEQHVGSKLNPPTDKDDYRLLSCFFWRPAEKRPIFKSYFDLASLYDSDKDGNNYHCSIFKRNDNYTFLYGDMNAPITDVGRNGVRYVSNNFEVQNLGRDVQVGDVTQSRRQPWILEMNEAGVHAQTIDGYQYVRGTSSTDPITLKQRLKEVVMYRLMEDKCYDEKNLISANVFGSDDNAKLYKYFNDNFADIILEMVGEGRAKYQIFRNIDSYGSTDQPKYFMNEIMDQEKLGDLTLLQQYVGATIEVKRRQRILSAIESADNKIYEYRKTQIDNAKNRRGKKRYENGLLAPMPVKYLTNQVKEYGTAHHYSEVLTPITFGDVFAYFDTNPTKVITRQYVRERTQNVINKQYITQYLASIIPNSDEGFSPQIQKAKEIESNRFWYKSSIVDRVLYSIMAGSTIANQIKGQTYQQYTKTKALTSDNYNIKDIIGIDPTKISTDAINNGVISTYISNRMLSGSNDFATYTDDPETTDFFGTILSNYQTKMAGSLQTDGEYNDDNLNYWLFLSTVAYLSKNKFEKLYDALATKIHENELAYVAYVTKFNYLALIDDKLDYDPAIPMESVDKIPFQWKANVDNIFDKSGYSGQTTPEKERESWNLSFDQYWHINQKRLFGNTNSTLAGFMGIQSASSNQFDQNSGLKDAATKDFATATYDSPKTPGGTDRYAQNEGVLFPWAYNGTEDVATKYDFGTITDPKGESTDEITINTFKEKGLAKAGKLAYNIAQCSTIDDLKTLAGTLSDAIYGHSIFSDIANGSYPVDKDHPVEDLKFIMLHEFTREDSEATDYSKYFNRLVNVELHTNIEIGGKYYFRDAETNDCYKVMLTQLNKSDLVDKLITPTWKPGVPAGHWEMNSNVGLTLDEFWYILFNAACDNANQQAAISDAVKNVFGDDKLVVYDAQIYNQFDSLWIKDWKRKTMP